MAKIPNIDRAILDPRKITDYLLEETHRIGRAKARLLMAFGFSPLAPAVLIAALLKHGQMYDAEALPPTPHGVKYVVRVCCKHPMAGI